MKLDSEQIIAVIYALIGDTNAHGESNADKQSRENQKLLMDVADTLLFDIVGNVKYAKRVEHSMKVIGEDAKEFLGYIVEEYGLDRYVERREE